MFIGQLATFVGKQAIRTNICLVLFLLLGSFRVRSNDGEFAWHLTSPFMSEPGVLT